MRKVPSLLLLLVLACLWGLSFPAIALGIEDLPPLVFAALRYDIAAVMLFVYAIQRPQKWRPQTSADLVAVTGGGLFLIGGNGLLFVGQQTVSSGIASILQALVPIFTALLAFVLLDEQLSLVDGAGVVVGFIGTALVVQPSPGGLADGDLFGRVLILGYAGSIAFGGVLIQQAKSTISREALTAWSMLLGGILLHCASVGIGESLALRSVTVTGLGSLVFLAVFATAIAFLIYFRILTRQGAFEANLVAYLVPIVSIAVGATVLDESINLLSIVGFGVIFSGFAILKHEILVELLTEYGDLTEPTG